jgi:predicted ABC-type transport system involved in lysophospholipase L1 biosynthesis ATPase subunit
MTRPIVALAEIGRTFGAIAPVVALRDVDLEVDVGDGGRGRCIGVRKTTLLNILDCLDRPTTGSYRLDGMDVANLSDPQRAGLRSRDIGFIFQSFHLLSYDGPGERHARRGLRRSRSRRPEGPGSSALEAVGLEGRDEFLPTQLSGGHASGSRSPAPSSTVPACSCATSRRGTWIRSRREASSR